MKSHSLNVLYRYRKFLLEKEQVLLQEAIAEENVQKDRMTQIQGRVRKTHDAKLKAETVEGMCVLDEAAAYLHGRMVMVKRTIGLAGLAREEALARTLKAKQARDQVGLLLEKGRREYQREQDEAERRQMDDLVTSRYAMAAGRLHA